jgi:hypothetical protein
MDGRDARRAPARRRARRVPEQLHGIRRVALGRVEAREQPVDERSVDVEAHAARADQAAPEAAAAEGRRHVQEVAAQAPAEGGRRKVGDVVRERAEVPDVVREALELERDASQRLRARRLLAAGQRLDHLAVGRRVSDRGVARERLRIVDGALARSADHRPLDAAVLVAERDLEMEDVLAVALEAEVPGLDHAGVNGPDGHFVHFVALDAVEVRDSDRGALAARPGKRLTAGAVRAVIADRLEPRMAERAQSELLGDLAFEQVRLGTDGRQRVEGSVRHARAREVQPRMMVVRQHGEQRHRGGIRIRSPEEGRDAQPPVDGLRDGAGECGRRELRHGVARRRTAVRNQREARLGGAGGAHGVHSR